MNEVIFQAGNLFKMAKMWKEAGDAFVRAAEIKGENLSFLVLRKYANLRVSTSIFSKFRPGR